jgi:hypothetical protein
MFPIVVRTQFYSFENSFTFKSSIRVGKLVKCNAQYMLGLSF